MFSIAVKTPESKNQIETLNRGIARKICVAPMKSTDCNRNQIETLNRGIASPQAVV